MGTQGEWPPRRHPPDKPRKRSRLAHALDVSPAQHGVPHPRPVPEQVGPGGHHGGAQEARGVRVERALWMGRAEAGLRVENGRLKGLGVPALTCPASLPIH